MDGGDWFYRNIDLNYWIKSENPPEFFLNLTTRVFDDVGQ
jgi:hypothetical protein